MSRRISFKLRGEKLNVAIKFADDLGMDLNTAAERALYWAIRQAYDPEYEMRSVTLKEPSDGETREADIARDSEQVPAHDASNSAALADTGSLDGDPAHPR